MRVLPHTPIGLDRPLDEALQEKLIRGDHLPRFCFAWLTYDESFRRRAAYDRTIPWDRIDLELWTVTFAGLAKPHYHKQED
ncbi:hypothetical protein QZH41_014467 [Actinostola sp. cb2023]|nr:hypothetical protein QZH41_014467 [Actinostola sp. cb2023]